MTGQEGQVKRGPLVLGPGPCPRCTTPRELIGGCWRCRPCRVKKYKEWVARNLEKVRADARERQKKNYGTPEGRRQKQAMARANMHATLGRVCDSCGATDAQTLWSTMRSRCCSCQRQGAKYGFCPSGCGWALRARVESCPKCSAKNPHYKPPCRCTACVYLQGRRSKARMHRLCMDLDKILAKHPVRPAWKDAWERFKSRWRYRNDPEYRRKFIDQVGACKKRSRKAKKAAEAAQLVDDHELVETLKNQWGDLK